MAKTYKVLKRGRTIKSKIPGRFAGCKPHKIFGRLDCASGKRRIKKENRVFFLTWEDAIMEGYRPCMRCMPLPDDNYPRR